MKTKSKLSAYILRRSAAALLFSGAIVALCSAIDLPNNHPKVRAAQSHAVVGANRDQNRTLSFADRVAYQRAIEDVFWHHRIWPKERPDPKPSLDAVMSQAQLEKKVTEYLLNSQALADDWQRPITAEQLQAEMGRMTTHSKQPEVLREIFQALGNDPFVIAECLARPVLAERLVTELNARDDRPTTVAWKRSLRSWLAKPATQPPVTMAAVSSANYTLPLLANPSGSCTDDTWTPTSPIGAPTARSSHTAVWTGSEMIVWGGTGDTTGGRYSPTTDSWTATSTTNAPTARSYHTAVWTGSEMIVWGGDCCSLNTGGKYNPATNSWTPTSTISAPTGRAHHTAVWTGSKMIVWGGGGNCGIYGYCNTGGQYDPSTDIWTATSTINVPTERWNHTAIWDPTHGEMIVWGGENYPLGVLNTGGRYNPATDTWTPTSTINAPAPRSFPYQNQAAVWTGTEMIVWGGFPNSFNTGGRYNPGTDSWTRTSIINAPEGRYENTAVWTNKEMIVWGGLGSGTLNTGGRYDPVTDSWKATTTSNAPSARRIHTAVYTGTEMIVWAGLDDSNTGGRYCAPAGLAVASSDPACGSVVFTQPTDFVINLTDPAKPATVQASDFTVNGTPANSLSLSNGNTTITFHYTSSPVITQGAQTMHIPAGAFLRAPDGEPVIEFDCTFLYDATLLSVTDTVPPVGGIFSPPAPRTYQYDVNWNEAIDPTSVAVSDLKLSGNTSATVTNVEVINGNTTTRFTLDVLFGGSLTADIAAGGITDQFGNPNAAFSGSYTVKGPRPTCITPPPDMVSWWPGDDNADDIVGSNDGTLQNGVTFASGMVGQAFSFDGVNDYVQAPDTGLPIGRAARTLDFWMQAEVNARVPVFYGDYAANDAFYILVQGTTACIGQWGGGDVCGSTDVTDGSWHHIAVMYDGSSGAVLYVDGTLETSATRTYRTTQTGTFLIGGTVVSSDYFHGLIDEVEIFSRALSQTEIQSIVDAGSAGKCKPTSLTLDARVHRQGGKSFVVLTWSPADGGSMDVLRDGVVVHATNDDGEAQDNLGTHTGTFVYQVCETDSGDCSNLVRVRVRGTGD